MTQSQRKALKAELRAWDRRIEAWTLDAQLKWQDREDFFKAEGRYRKMHPYNKGPRDRMAAEARSRLADAKERMKQIRELLK